MFHTFTSRHMSTLDTIPLALDLSQDPYLVTVRAGELWQKIFPHPYRDKFRFTDMTVGPHLYTDCHFVEVQGDSNAVMDFLSLSDTKIHMEEIAEVTDRPANGIHLPSMKRWIIPHEAITGRRLEELQEWLLVVSLSF